MTNATAVAEAHERPTLRAVATMAEALRIAWSGKWLWLRLSIVPLALHGAGNILLLVFLALRPEFAMQQEHQAGAAPGRDWFSPLGGIILALAYVPAATAWMRSVIAACPPGDRPRYSIGRREHTYINRFLQIVFGTIGIVFAFGYGGIFVGGLGRVFVFTAVVLGLTCALWFLTSFVLCLPAAANGDDASFRAAAALAQGNRFALLRLGVLAYLTVIALGLGGIAVGMGVVIGAVILILLLVGPLQSAPTGLEVTILAIIMAVQLALAWLSTLLHATALACAYRRLRAQAVPPANAPSHTSGAG